MSNLLIIFFVTFLFWLARYHWKRRRFYQISSKLSGPMPLPIIGNALSFAGSNTKILQNAMAFMVKYQSPSAIWLGQKLFIGMSEPEHLEVILNHPNTLQKGDIYKFTMPIVGLGLFTAPVPLWKKHRKIIMPTFNQKILDGFVEIFTEQGLILLDQLEKKCVGKGSFDVFPYFSLFTLDAICETAMGISINAQTTNTDFLKWTQRTMEISFSRMLHIWYHFDFIFNLTTTAKEFSECCENLRAFTSTVVRQKREAYRQKLKENGNREAECEEGEGLRRHSFLQQLIELSERGDYLSDNEIRDEVITVMIGGSETTASINSFILIMLGMHPEVQEKVYREVMDVIGPDRPVEHTDIPKLPYLEMAIKETMRLFPVGPMIVRSVTGDVKLHEGCVIPAGCSAVICAIYTHRNPKLWPDPLKFDPLRFLPSECAKRHPYSFLPFSGGPRNCIGLKYAMIAMKAVIAMVVRKYKVKTVYEKVEDINIKQDIVLKPIDGYLISLEHRHPK